MTKIRALLAGVFCLIMWSLPNLSAASDDSFWFGTTFETKLAALIVGESPSFYQGDIYLLRGFANVFSTGLDEMAATLNQRGIAAHAIWHGGWGFALNRITNNQRRFGRKPVILIGHSLGANAAIKLARELKTRHIPVTYLATFAATNPGPVPSNVSRATNFYFATNGWGEELIRGQGFRGRLSNIDFSNSKTIGHFNIEEQKRLQKRVLHNVLRIVRPVRRAEASPSLIAAGR